MRYGDGYMIEVIYRLGIPYDDEKNEMLLEVRGHAGYAAPGRDIVCAAASILFQTYASWVELEHESGMIPDEPEIVKEKGFSRVAFKPPREMVIGSREHLALIVNGYRLLSESYPHNVKVSETVGFDT